MRNSLGWVNMVCAVLFLSACGFQLERAQGLEPTGGTFREGLYAGYIELSKREFEEADYIDSDAFAERAILAVEGRVPLPESLSERRLPKRTINELNAARELLIGLLEKGVKQEVGKIAADAQVYFDCWMQEQEEDIQPEHIQACRVSFSNAIKILKQAHIKPSAKLSKIKKLVQKEKVSVDSIYILYFGFDSVSLSTSARRLLVNIGADYKRAGPSKVYVEGHADTSGSRTYNEALSYKRAEVVMKALIAQGVPGEFIELVARGENYPIIMGANRKEPKNRRVEIIFD